MFTFKPKKVFEKVSKMDRKQAYTIGAIVIVLVVALLMLFSAVGSEDDSFAGMNARGYDLATMPFASDAAEKFLLANTYPDMQENGATLLYSSAEKEARQAADAQTDQEAQTSEENLADRDFTSGKDFTSAQGHGWSGRGGSGAGTKTQVGQLGTADRATAGGTGLNTVYGPTGDFRQYKGREDRGNEAPLRFNTGNARGSLSQFRSQSLAAARQQNNKMANAGKALYGGYVANSDVLGKDGVDLSKVGGMELDTSAPPTTADLDNIDKKVAEAVKQKEKEKQEEKREWWEDMLIDLAKQAASGLVGAVVDTAGDSLKGWINGNNASRAAGKEAWENMKATPWNKISEADKAKLPAGCADKGGWPGCVSGKSYGEVGKYVPSIAAARHRAYGTKNSESAGSTHTDTHIGQKEDNLPEGTVKDSTGKTCAANLLKDGKCP